MVNEEYRTIETGPKGKQRKPRQGESQKKDDGGNRIEREGGTEPAKTEDTNDNGAGNAENQ